MSATVLGFGDARGPRPGRHNDLVEVEKPVVEQAKGVLMLRYGVGSYEAFAVLLGWSHEAGLSVAVVARALVEGVCQGRVSPYGGRLMLVRWLEQKLRGDLSDDLSHDHFGRPEHG
jgi:ANTAR domain